MQEPQDRTNAGWRPAGVAPLHEAGKPLAQSLSLPTLRRGPPSRVKRVHPYVTIKELKSLKKRDPKPDKEIRFVAREMNKPTAKAQPVMSTNVENCLAEETRFAYSKTKTSLEEAMKARKHEPWKKASATWSPGLPTNLNALIRFGDALFEPFPDEGSTMASTMTMPTMPSITASYESTVRLPDILPKAKPVIKDLAVRLAHTSQLLSALPNARKETKVEAERRENRELVKASWSFQQHISPVKVSISHMNFS